MEVADDLQEMFATVAAIPLSTSGVSVEAEIYQLDLRKPQHIPVEADADEQCSECPCGLHTAKRRLDYQVAAASSHLNQLQPVSYHQW